MSMHHDLSSQDEAIFLDHAFITKNYDDLLKEMKKKLEKSCDLNEVNQCSIELKKYIYRKDMIYREYFFEDQMNDPIEYGAIDNTIMNSKNENSESKECKLIQEIHEKLDPLHQYEKNQLFPLIKMKREILVFEQTFYIQKGLKIFGESPSWWNYFMGVPYKEFSKKDIVSECYFIIDILSYIALGFIIIPLKNLIKLFLEYLPKKLEIFIQNQIDFPEKNDRQDCSLLNIVHWTSWTIWLVGRIICSPMTSLQAGVDAIKVSHIGLFGNSLKADRNGRDSQIVVENPVLSI